MFKMVDANRTEIAKIEKTRETRENGMRCQITGEAKIAISRKESQTNTKFKREFL
jgi:hypothetical protein